MCYFFFLTKKTNYMKNLLRLSILFFFLTLCSCKDKKILFHGQLSDGITGEVLPDQLLLISNDLSFSVSFCTSIRQEAKTDSDGRFSFNFIQDCSTELTLGEGSYIPSFGRHELRVTDLNTDMVWDNSANLRTIDRPIVPNTDINTEVKIELLPYITINPKRSSDSTLIVDRITIEELGVVIDTIFEDSGQTVNQLEKFLTKLDNDFSVSVKYTDGTVKDSTYSHNYLNGPFLTISY